MMTILSKRNTSFVKLYLLLSLLLYLPFTSLSGQVYINEVCSSNSSLIADPEYGKYSDWIEIYNGLDSIVDLSNHYLSDDSASRFKWAFPAGTVILPDSFLLVFADGTGTGLHTNFKLEKSGEFLSLYDSANAILISCQIPYLLNDLSYGLLPGDKTVSSVFEFPTPASPNSGTEARRIVSFPEFSVSGGFYDTALYLSLSNPYPDARIFYTLDGSYPDITSSEFADSILVDRTSVIRALAVEEGTIEGIAITQTYFINEPQNLPIFSLVTDSVHLFSDETGIMVQGTNGRTGYCTNVPHNLNQDWERPVNLEFYEMDGSQALNQMCGTKIFGGCSRIRYPQKSLAFFARNEYESSSFQHQLFPDKFAEEYETFILRASGDDQPNTIFRDPLTQMLVKDVIDVDMQAYRPVVLYINGKYWGIINMREKLNEHYAANNFGVDADSVSVLRRNPESTWNVIAGSADHYNEMMEFVKANDMTLKANYEYVGTQMDIDEYLNYQITQIFFGGRDWPGNNIKFWRSDEEPYNRWRWILYDLDPHSKDVNGNIMEESTELDCGCSWPNPPWSTILFRTLLTNEEFANEFIERFCRYADTHFARERILEKIDELQEAIRPEIPRHIERWGGQKVDNPDNTWMSPIFNSMEEWEANVQVMRNFAMRRHEVAVQQTLEYFGLAGTKRLTINQSIPGGSLALLDNDRVNDSLFKGDFVPGTEMDLELIPEEGFSFVRWERDEYTLTENMLVASGDVWKFYEGGEWLDPVWRTASYDDSGWESGQSQLGYGDGDEATVVSYGSDPDNKTITTYFRKAFSIDDTLAIDLYELQVIRDDGIVVFINGHEIFQDNMPQYGYGNASLATETVGGDDEDRFLIFDVNPAFFNNGENIVAAEVHQVDPSSSDISFDLQLKTSRFDPGLLTEFSDPEISITLNEHMGFNAIVVPEPNPVQNVFINEIVSSNGSGLADEAGDYDDWIEFYNAGTEVVDLAGLYLADTVPYSKPWRFPVGRPDLTRIEPDSFIVVVADNETWEGPMHTDFRLSSLGEELILAQRIGFDTIIVDQVAFDTQYRDLAWGRYPDGSDSFKWMAQFTPWRSNKYRELSVAVLENIRINEIVARGQEVYPDEAGEYEDWIELYNASGQALDLAGLILSDTLPATKPWRFPYDMPEITTIEADSFLVVFADGEEIEGPLHTNFRLNGLAEEVALMNIEAVDTTLIDHVVYTPQYSNFSWGRYPNGADNFEYLSYHSPWFSNAFTELTAAMTDDLYINEIMASNIDKFADEAGDFEDWIEIYNAGNERIDLAGLFLSDTLPALKPWRFPYDASGSTVIEPDSFIIVFADEEAQEGLLHADFRLTGGGEEVALLHISPGDTSILDHVVFEAQYNNVSWGRFPDASETFQFMPHNTPWYSNFWEPLDTTGISDYFTNDMLSVFPNPAREECYILFPEKLLAEHLELRIYSFTGRLVRQQMAVQELPVRISLDDEAAGLYLIELRTNAGSFVKRLIKL